MAKRAHLLAGLLAILFVTLGGSLGSLIGAWILPPAVALAHGGFVEVASLPRSHGVFPEPPDWLMSYSETMYGAVKVGSGILLIVGMVVVTLLGQRLWRYLVVRKLGWMTDEEVEAFWKRDPGF